MIEPAVLIDALLPENRSSILISPCDFTFIVPFDVERGRARLALVRGERAQDRGVGEERREQLIVDDLELELLLEAAIGLERDLHRNRRRRRHPSVRQSSSRDPG